MRVCVCTARKISKDNVSHQPSVRYFQQPLLFHRSPGPLVLSLCASHPPAATCYSQHPGRSAVERRIRQEVKSESYFPRRFFSLPVPFLLRGTRAPPWLSFLFLLFASFLLSLFGCLACFASLSGRPARQETESRVKTVGCRRVKPRVDSLQRVRYRARRVHVHTYAYKRMRTYTYTLHTYIRRDVHHSPDELVSKTERRYFSFSTKRERTGL